MNSRQSSSNSRTQNIACSPFSLRTVVTAVHATIRLTFGKAWRMGDEISEGRWARRGVALHHDNPVEVSSSECGKVDQPTTIDILPDDVLLDIFDHHRLTALDSFGPWQWHRLAHVCRRWRSVVFASPRRLDLRLVYTYKKPVRKTLDCWPPFPISIWYPRSLLYRPLAPPDEHNVIAALEHSDRIYDITLTITRPLLEKLAPLMQKPFPVLQDLQLITRDMMWSLVLPSAFLGGSTPRLRHIELTGTAFPTLPRLLLSAVDLVSLRLYEIPNMGYFSPEALVVGLYATPQLKFLTIRFQSPTYRGQEDARPPLLNHALLPALSKFSFKGDMWYLEDLVARIDAPIVDEFDTTFSDNNAYEITQLTQFICRTEELKSSPHRTSIFLFDEGLEITLYFGHPSLRGTFRLRMACAGADTQVLVLACICRQLSPLVSSAEYLDVESNQPWPDQRDEADNEELLELFSPFNGVRRIEVVGTLVPSVASALEQSVEEIGQVVLPALQDLHLKDTPPSLPEVESFVAARRLSGHVVTVHYAEE